VAIYSTERREDATELLTAWRAAAWRVAEAWELWRAAEGGCRDHAHTLYEIALAEEELAADQLRRQATVAGGR